MISQSSAETSGAPGESPGSASARSGMHDRTRKPRTATDRRPKKVAIVSCRRPGCGHPHSIHDLAHPGVEQAPMCRWSSADGCGGYVAWAERRKHRGKPLLSTVERNGGPGHRLHNQSPRDVTEWGGLR